MNGIGWVCDQCGTRVVLEGDLTALALFRPPPPHGWYTLFLRPSSPGIEADCWHFCDAECVMDFAGQRREALFAADVRGADQ